jgi:bifunctional DNase/RNase
MLEMKVFGLALDEDSQVPVLILKDREEKTVLPIWIGPPRPWPFRWS